MAITLNTTKGSPDANAYADVSEADALLEQLYQTDEWFALDDSEKMKLLVTGANYIDRLPVKYESADSSQALKFPLDNEDDGFEIAKEASIWQAWYLYLNLSAIDGAQASAIENIRTENLGKVQTTKFVGGINPMRKYEPYIFRLFQGFLNLNNRIY